MKLQSYSLTKSKLFLLYKIEICETASRSHFNGSAYLCFGNSSLNTLRYYFNFGMVAREQRCYHITKPFQFWYNYEYYLFWCSNDDGLLAKNIGKILAKNIGLLAALHNKLTTLKLADWSWSATSIKVFYCQKFVNLCYTVSHEIFFKLYS